MRLKGVAEDVLVPALTEAGGKVLHVCRAG